MSYLTHLFTAKKGRKYLFNDALNTFLIWCFLQRGGGQNKCAYFHLLTTICVSVCVCVCVCVNVCVNVCLCV